MKILIDTNIILDALMSRDPWEESAQNLFLAIAKEKAEGCITASSFTDLYYLLRKHLHDNEKTKQTLLGLLAVITVLDAHGTDCEKAINHAMTDVEDALLAQCANRHKVSYIVTRNSKHFQNSPVKPISPDDLLKILE